MNPYVLAELYPKDRSLQARWFVQWKIFDVQKNKLITEQKRVPSKLKTPKERERWAKEFIAQINKALIEGYVIDKPTEISEPVPEILPFLTAIQKAYSYKSKSLRQKSVDTYSYYLSNFEKFCSSKGLENAVVLPKTLGIDYQDYLLELGLSNRTVNNNIDGLKGLISEAVKRGLAESVKLNISPLEQTDGDSNTAFSPQHQKMVEDYLKQKDFRLYLFTRFVYAAFVRRKELRYLKVKHIDFRQKMLTVWGNIAKTKITRNVKINPSLWKLIEEMNLKDFDGECYIFGKDLKTVSFPKNRSMKS